MNITQNKNYQKYLFYIYTIYLFLSLNIFYNLKVFSNSDKCLCFRFSYHKKIFKKKHHQKKIWNCSFDVFLIIFFSFLEKMSPRLYDIIIIIYVFMIFHWTGDYFYLPLKRKLKQFSYFRFCFVLCVYKRYFFILKTKVLSI